MSDRFQNLGSRKAAAVLIAGLASSVFAAQPVVDFDQGIDVSSILKDAKKKADNVQLEPKQFKAAFDRWERDCATISIGANDPTTT